MIQIRGDISKETLISLLQSNTEIGSVEVNIIPTKAKDNSLINTFSRGLPIEECEDKCKKIKEECCSRASCLGCPYGEGRYLFCEGLTNLYHDEIGDPCSWTDEDIKIIGRELYNTIQFDIKNILELEGEI